MGDAGEGLIDAESRIQERMEELEQARARRGGPPLSPERVQAVDSLKSLKLARTEYERQRDATANEARRTQLTHALSELDRRMAELTAIINRH
jgi:hypothetical protein